METKDFQYKGEQFSIRWDPKEEVIFSEVWGNHDKNDATEFMNNTNEIIKKFGIKIPYVLIDASRQKASDHEARRVYTKWLRDDPMKSYSAICGGNTLIRIIINFIFTTTKNKRSKVFATLEEGLKWLKKMQA